MEERPRLEIELDVPGAGQYAADLERGALFVPGTALAVDVECDVLFLAGEEAFSVPARVVIADARGTALALVMAETVRRRLVTLAAAAPPAMDLEETVDEDEPPPPAARSHGAAGDATALDAAALDAAALANGDPDGDGLGDGDGDGHRAGDDDGVAADPSAPRTSTARNIFERLRGLTLVQQHKLAREGELHERMALERIYGKTVWEALLRNPRITAQEVARISRKGNLPRPQLELIVGNAAWLGVPEVRRALLTNPRLGTDMIPRVLRLLSKQELKVATTTVAYPMLVRETARRILREQGVVPR